MIIGLEYKYAILSVLFGGIGGFLFFYFLSKRVEKILHFIWPQLCRTIPASIKKRYNLFCEHHAEKRPKNIFSKKSRFLVRTKISYGFWGIIIATPVLLTIPIGAFLANRYYAQRKHLVLYMILSIVGWAGVLSGLVHLFPKVFF